MHSGNGNALKNFADSAKQNAQLPSWMSQRQRARDRGRPPLEVRYHAGIGSGGTDEILRPTLMSVGGGGSCYRLVRDSFGRRPGENREEEEFWQESYAEQGVQ